MSGVRSKVGRGVRRTFGWRPYPAEDSPSCALCGAHDRVTVARRVSDDMRYPTVVCRACGLVYMFPRPSAASFRHFYEAVFVDLFDGSTANVDIRAEVMSSERGRPLLEFLSESRPVEAMRAVLDIGCGDGGLLLGFADVIGERGLAGKIALAGCDPARPPGEAVERIRAGSAISIWRRGVEEVAVDVSEYDVLVMFDVLEHLLEPRRVLQHLHDGARDDTLLFVATSCLDHFNEIPAAGFEDYYLRIGHPYTFTSSSLRRLLASAGWRVEREAPAAKGDQWVVARRDTPDPSATDPVAGACAQALEFIRSYKARCA